VHDVSLVALMGRLIVAMGIVVGLMIIAGRVVRNRGLGGAVGRGPASAPVRIEVLARQGFGRNASVAVIRAAGKGLVLGVTETNVTVLAEADLTALDAQISDEAIGTASSGARSSSGPSWKAMLELARDKTVRRS